ncbi:hypothetical protein FACS1894199_09500 [Bacteroidia bacterium]|nr:hypothetical protein FACS1894199_09500 [Bacteroidia bacterium]
MAEENSHTWADFIRKFYNKYIITGLLLLFFLIWMCFFDRNNWIERGQIRSKISTLQNEKTYYQKKIEEDTRKIEELRSNRDNLEKFAREQYLMKNTNEDIFVIMGE